MELKHIKGVGPAKQAKLQQAGITTVEDLARADVAAVAEKSGLSAAAVKEYKEAAVGLTLMQDIRGLGPNTIKTLAEGGIRNLKDLYEASSERLAAEAKVAQEKAREWQDEARKVYEHVREGAKTPEGRQQLAQEGRDLAVRAAKATRDQAEKMLANAQKEGEAAIAKAQELREKAPAILQDYRQKAEKALHDAEAQVKAVQEKAPAAVKDAQAKAEKAVQDAQKRIQELRSKTEEFVKAETEKVRAANQGFLSRLKARFSGQK